MAARKDVEYPGRWEAATPEYPMGKPKNRTTSTSKDGSYLEKKWIQDYEAFFGALLNEAGVSPNGSVDTAESSQFFDALIGITLKMRVGQRVEMHSNQTPAWMLKADGSAVSRVTDDVLWDHAQSSSLLIGQSLKDADPIKYAMYYGDGDGSTTFSLPNWYLGHFARGNPPGVALGETQESQNLEHDHIGYVDGAQIVAEGVNGVARYEPTGRTTKEGGDEARPNTGNINVFIERGKIPS